MTRQKSPTFPPPTRGKLHVRLGRQQLWRWFVEPSPKITEPDQRRQATLLTGFLLALIVVAIVVEIVTAFLIDWANYTGYRQTIVAVVLLAVVYYISRTQYLQIAATQATWPMPSPRISGALPTRAWAHRWQVNSRPGTGRLPRRFWLP